MRRLVLLLLAVGASAQVPSGLDGRWSGAAVYEGGALRLFDLEIDVAGPDALSVVLTQPYNGFTRFAVPFAYEPSRAADGEIVAALFGDEMRLLVDLADGTLRGTVVSGRNTTATVSLQRVLDVPLPSYRIKPASFVAGADTLAGSLVLPTSEGPHPVALMVPGRGYGYGRGEMANWATMMARNGIGAFVYDARGTGQSTGSDSLTTGEDRVEDVRAALDLLETHPDVRTDALGVVSNSAGAWVTPTAIVDRDSVAFWISLVGPTGSLAEQQSAAVRQSMRDSGRAFTDRDYAAASLYQTRLVNLAAARAPWSSYVQMVAGAQDRPWAEFVDLPERLDDEQIRYFSRRPRFSNTDALRRLRVPMLAIYGAADGIVPPSEHVGPLRALAAEAGNDDLTILVLDGVEHSLGIPDGAVGAGDWPTGYTRVWGRPGVLFTTMVEWTRQQVGLD